MAGLRIDEELYWFQWMFPIKIAVRAFERIVGSQPSPAQVPAGWINRALYLWSRLEQKLVGPVRPPFGSSLVVIGGDVNRDPDGRP